MEKRPLHVTMQGEGCGSIHSQSAGSHQWRDQGQLWGPGNARAARVRNTCHINDFLVGSSAFRQSAVFSILQFWIWNAGWERLHSRPAVRYPVGWRRGGPFTAARLAHRSPANEGSRGWERWARSLSERGWRATVPFSVSSRLLSCRSADAEWRLVACNRILPVGFCSVLRWCLNWNAMTAEAREALSSYSCYKVRLKSRLSEKCG